jgi:general secretion pathway protein D
VLQPNDAKYLTAYTRLRFRAAAEHVHKGEVLLDGQSLPQALAEFLRATEIDPTNDISRQEAKRTRELIHSEAKGEPEPPEEYLSEMAGRAQGPITLQPFANSPITLNMTAASNVIYKSVAALAGINVTFDPDYTPKKISVELNGVALKDALQILAWASKTYWRPLTANTIYVTSEGKRKEIEQSVMKTFYLSNTDSAADLTEAATAMHSMLDIAHVQPIPSQNALLVRATPDQLVLAEKLLSDIDKAQGEVVMDVAILEVTRDRLRTLGANLPTSATVSLAPVGTSSGTGGSTTLNSLAGLNAADFSVTIPGASFTALMTDSDTRTIQHPQMRVLDNQKATLKIGDRVPVATGSFSPGVGGAGINALVNTQFSYLDVGVSVDMTPHIHSKREVTLKISMEISSVTGEQNIGGVTQPVIGQRRIDHATRLREGEVNLLGGFMEDSQSNSISGYPWLANIPLLRYLFGQSSKDHTQREIVFAITPHIVRAQDVSVENLRAIDVGTSSAIDLSFNGASKRPANAPQVSDSSQQQELLKPPQPLPQPTQPSPQQAVPTQNPVATEPRLQAEEAATQAANTTAAPVQNAAASPPTPTAVRAGNTTLSLEPASVSQPVGSIFKVYVSVSGAQNVFSIPLEISYDPQRLQVVDVSNGGFLAQNMQSVALVYHSDTAKGTLQITGTRPPNSGGASGSGMAFVITLAAKSIGESAMAITGLSVLDPNMQASPAVAGNVLIKINGTETPNRPVGPPDREKQPSDDKNTAPPALLK